jgi:HK97 family phage prohead protease
MDGSFTAPCEFKFTASAALGEFEGYASVFDHQDWHGDIMLKGAFSDTLEEHARNGTMPAMFVEHSAWKGGDPLPIGVWTEIAEDDNGLRVKGKLSGLDTDPIKRIHGLMKDGGLRGLSVAFAVRKGGSFMGKKAGEPKRTLKAVDLFSVDPVRDPSNALARIDGLKSTAPPPNVEGATNSVAAALLVHRNSMSGSGGPTADQRAALLNHLQDAHQHLTGKRLPDSMKSLPATLRAFESWIRDEFGVSHAMARQIAEGGFKTAQEPRDEAEERQADPAASEAIGEIAKALRGFSLSSS